MPQLSDDSKEMFMSFVYGIVRCIAVFFFLMDCVDCLTTGTSQNRSAASLDKLQATGSMGRWRYDNVYKDTPLRVASPGMNAAGMLANDARVNMHIVYRNANITTTTTVIPTAKPAVDLSAKGHVQWFDDSLAYGLNATYDYRFKIRHAPIPRFGSPWPMPQSYLPSNITHRINVLALDLSVIGNLCPILRTYFERIKRNLLGSCEQPSGTYFLYASGSISSLSVTVLKKCTRYPYLEMDEAYDLVVKSSGVSIVSKEVWGAMRGMETFSQLVYQDNSGQYWINEVVIHDFPRFKHRGLLLDTSRHYLKKEVIIENIEAMAQNKLNVFHWHIVDDQSFPYQSKIYPLLTKLGAYDPETLIYTHEDIAEVIEAARIRGIRVIPEFDTPGHTFSWGFGQEHLLTPCYDYQGKPNGKYGPVNPTLKKNYRFLKNLFQEVLTVFKDKYIHLGGDEVPFECWLSNPFIQKFMQKNKVSDIRKVLNLYEKELLKSVTEIGVNRKAGSGYIVWQEVFDNEVKLNPDTIVQVWNGDVYNLERVINTGLKAIFSSCWYLDYISYGQDWDKYYRCDALSYRTLNESLFIGGEVCMWSEFVDNEGLTPRIWPRASAAAERLWSNQQVNDVHEASTRIEAQRCRMIRTGLKVGVLSGPGHCPLHKNAAGVPCSDQKISDPDEKSSRSSTLVVWFPFLVVILILVIIFLQVIPAQKRRLISVIVHVVQGSTLRRKLILVFVSFSGAWFLWWMMRQTWFSHRLTPSTSAI